MNDLVSIIIPTYGRAELLPRALSSIRDQSHKEIEVIIVDDNVDDVCSSNTKLLLNDYNDLKISYIKNKKNLGGGLSRNVGIEHSSGEYISFLDDDDYLLPSKIKEQLDFIKKNNNDVVLCHMAIENENGVRINKCHIARCDDLADFIIRGVSFTPMILMRNLTSKGLGYFRDTPRFQDHLFILDLLAEGKDIAILDKVLAVHYQHSGIRISNSDNTNTGYNIRLKAESELISRLPRKLQCSAKLKHATINSKIITDKQGRIRGITHLASNVFNIRTAYDLRLFYRNMIRNIFFPKSYF